MAGQIHFVTYVSQNILKGPNYPSKLETRSFPRQRAGDAVQFLLDGQISWRESAIPVGITLDQDHTQQIIAIGLSTSTRAARIAIEPTSVRDLGLMPNDKPFISLMSGKGRFVAKHAVVGEEKEYMNGFVLVGFDFARVAVLVRKYVGVDVRGVDLGSLVSPEALAPWSPGRMMNTKVDQNANAATVNRCWDQRFDQEAFFMRAWLSNCVAERCRSEVTAATQADTKALNFKELQCVQDMVAEAFWIEQLRPSNVLTEVSDIRIRKDGAVELHNERYKSRVRRSERQEVVLVASDGSEHRTRARAVQGKTTTLHKVQSSTKFKSAAIIGRQDSTTSERRADHLLLSVLQRKKTFQDSPFIRLFWFPTWKKFRPPDDTAALNPKVTEQVIRMANLNASQAKVVEMAGSNQRCVLVHGPPGTGKTTTIAAISRIWDLHDCPVWIVAHSNVAVKNIALALHKRDVDFKILVAKEFYEEWHEHLYEAISAKVIRSDTLPATPRELEALIGGSCIVLSTLGMLSNPALEERGVFKEVPVERLIVDEASQIRIFEFLHLFERFRDLEKMFFFGDPQQLPPHNSENIRGMKTVFDLPHLNGPERCFLLNIQYRMPVALGSFISTHVYDGKLNSSHHDTSSSCLSFVNVSYPHGEETKEGTGWKNDGEARTVVRLIKEYYRHLDFTVITPYDGQRGHIVKLLKADGLPWEEVYNIDSFQGHERDYVIVSVVRTDKPGFLTLTNRLNVMLTRCKKGMVIVTNEAFLLKGRDLLLRHLASHWERRYGHSKTWVSWKDILDACVDVPGVMAPRPNRLASRPIGRSIAVPWTSSYASATLAGNGGGAMPSQVSQRYQGASGRFDPSKLFRKLKPRAPTFASVAASRAEPQMKAPFTSHHVLPTRPHPANPFSLFDAPELDGTFDESGGYDDLLSLPIAPTRNEPRVAFDESAFPGLDSMSTEDEERLRTTTTRSSSAWGLNRSSLSHGPSASATRPAPNPIMRQTSSSRPQIGSAYRPAVDLTFPSLSDHARFSPSQTSRVGNIMTSTLHEPQRRTIAPAPIHGVGGDGGGWTRVERRRGHGRKKVEVVVLKPLVQSNVYGQKKKGYRYWVGL
ncbi:hypothetical protein D9611_012174 [Ephemerocybe angulata]|uniref:DNA2/NAM7 helicase-like C-terminal domain-containing protein n=1 Tax=Ephemerocybe angulata TaxID=980116 RepID=A0A8H5FGD7_9AGAR|nr:hypothetical protein D9611_012174 [Tulosesus angulatus]